MQPSGALGTQFMPAAATCAVPRTPRGPVSDHVPGIVWGSEQTASVRLGLSASRPRPPCRSACTARRPDGQRPVTRQARLVPLAVVFAESLHAKTYEFCR